MNEIPLAELRRHGVVRVAGARAETLVVLVNGEIKAYNGVCPHLGGPLLEAEIRGERIICPWHHYEWSLATGKCLTVPGKPWDGVEGYRRPTAPYSCNLAPVRFEIVGDSIRLNLAEHGEAPAAPRP